MYFCATKYIETLKTKLSVNINKVALIRNSRGENLPDLVKFAQDCENYGAQGITIHPRPDQRHARYSDVSALKAVIQTELNIEGYPTEEFLNVVLDNVPHQCTLVPDPPGALTSSEGWDTKQHQGFLNEVCHRLKEKGIRVSIFLDPIADLATSAAATGTDRVEFYTGHYAKQFIYNRELAIANHIKASEAIAAVGLGLNAGHDLNLDNLKYYADHVYGLAEVSIGHALICDALYLGIQNTIGMYRRCLM
jgi:pyridoxine 5-phosphate synthase